MDIRHALDRFLLQLQADGRSPHTLGQYRRHILLLAQWLDRAGHSGAVGDITDEHLARFLASDAVRMTAAGTPRRASSANALRGSLKGFFGFLVRAEILVRDPSRLIRRALTAPAPPRAIRKAEEERLLAVLREAQGPEAERDRVLVELMLRTGVRLSSALALGAEDVDLDEGVLLLRRAKGGRCERVLLGDGIRDTLREYLVGRTSGPVFPCRAGRRISARHAQRRIRLWREAAGISESVTAHSFRHAFGQRLYDRTHDLLLVKAALGHRSVASTLTYARVAEGALRLALVAGPTGPLHQDNAFPPVRSRDPDRRKPLS